MQGIEIFIPTIEKIAYLNQLLKVGYDTLDAGSSFLVEFTKGNKVKKDSCDWMGVLNASEIEVVGVQSSKL